MAVCIDGYSTSASEIIYAGSPGPWVEADGQQASWLPSAVVDRLGPGSYWQENVKEQPEFGGIGSITDDGGIHEWPSGSCVQTIAAGWPIFQCGGEWQNADGYQGHRGSSAALRKRRFCTSYPDVGQCRRGSTCAFAHSREEICAPLLDTDEERQDPGALTDSFFMYKYKTRWCPIGVQHEWHTCVYAHNYQDARRPVSIGYGARLCPYWSKKDTGAEYSQRCPLGLRCPYSHGAKEQLYHPQYFKTVICRDVKGKACPRQKLCAFHHNRAERRLPPTDDVDYSTPLTNEAIPSGWAEEFLSPPFATSTESIGGSRGAAGHSPGCGGCSPSLAGGGGFDGVARSGASGCGVREGRAWQAGVPSAARAADANAMVAALPDSTAVSVVSVPGAVVGNGSVTGGFPYVTPDVGGSTAMSTDQNKMQGAGQMMVFLMPVGAIMPQMASPMSCPPGQMVLVPMGQAARQH